MLVPMPVRMPMRSWSRLCTRAELCLPSTLRNGQSFAWRVLPSGNFAAVLEGHIVALRHVGDAPDDFVEVCAPMSVIPAVRAYLQLDKPLAPLVALWSKADARVAAVATALPGMRVLRQDPWQCLVSFICSSNNNISRITSMLDRLCAAYGTFVGELEGVAFYSFPTPAAVAAVGEAPMRELGFGYRARYVARTAESVLHLGGEAYLHGLRGQPRDAVQTALMTFDGCGRKVADCVALFSLDRPDAVPVDTHVWAIARCYYGAADDTAHSGGAAAATLTPALYNRVGDIFRELFGDHAGWAHCLLFAAELPAFSAALPSSLSAEMGSFRGKEKLEKAAAREAARARKTARTKSTAGSGANSECDVTESAVCSDGPTAKVIGTTVQGPHAVIAGSRNGGKRIAVLPPTAAVPTVETAAATRNKRRAKRA